MKTRTDKILERGIKENPMFEQNTVECSVSTDEYNRFITEFSQMRSAPKGNATPMEFFDTTTKRRKKSPRLIIEIEEPIIRKIVLK